ncbi:hypothetical protein EDD85DRAFT_957867 [Armillaria nabsnona]|nr:hypothetical protein EDD85DRAFT_957867 [Armillaria nabsnona]
MEPRFTNILMLVSFKASYRFSDNSSSELAEETLYRVHGSRFWAVLTPCPKNVFPYYLAIHKPSAVTMLPISSSLKCREDVNKQDFNPCPHPNLSCQTTSNYHDS